MTSADVYHANMIHALLATPWCERAASVLAASMHPDHMMHGRTFMVRGSKRPPGTKHCSLHGQWLKACPTLPPGEEKHGNGSAEMLASVSDGAMKRY